MVIVGPFLQVDPSVPSKDCSERKEFSARRKRVDYAGDAKALRTRTPITKAQRASATDARTFHSHPVQPAETRATSCFRSTSKFPPLQQRSLMVSDKQRPADADADEVAAPRAKRAAPSSLASARSGGDARHSQEQLKKNQERLGVGNDHRTDAMKKGRRGTFP
jgi:hypothetical protein